jgi:hypothetical protein
MKNAMQVAVCNVMVFHSLSCSVRLLGQRNPKKKERNENVENRNEKSEKRKEEREIPNS